MGVPNREPRQRGCFDLLSLCVVYLTGLGAFVPVKYHFGMWAGLLAGAAAAVVCMFIVSAFWKAILPNQQVDIPMALFQAYAEINSFSGFEWVIIRTNDGKIFRGAAVGQNGVPQMLTRSKVPIRSEDVVAIRKRYADRMFGPTPRWIEIPVSSGSLGETAFRRTRLGEPMEVSDEPVKLGLQMLEERRRLLGQATEITSRDRERVSRQMEFAREPWSKTRQLLHEHPDIIRALEDLWPRVVPYLIKGNEVSPLHHIAYVVMFMTRIGLAELSPSEMKRGILAALMHDIGIGDCALPKISEASIERAEPDDKIRLRRDGIASRLEHMQLGVRIASGLLRDYRQRDPEFLDDDDIASMLEIIGSHDYSKIPLMADHVERKWLLSPDRRDWLKQCHWEADALWMLTAEGIVVDLEREHEENNPATRRAKFVFNLGLHRKIIELYAQAYSPTELASFGFCDGLLYRSATGYELAQELGQQNVAEQPPSAPNVGVQASA